LLDAAKFIFVPMVISNVPFWVSEYIAPVRTPEVEMGESKLGLMESIVGPGVMTPGPAAVTNRPLALSKKVWKVTVPLPVVLLPPIWLRRSMGDPGAPGKVKFVELIVTISASMAERFWSMVLDVKICPGGECPASS